MGAYVIEIGDNSESGGQPSNSSQSPDRCVIEYQNPSETCCWKIPLRLAMFIISAVEIVGVTVNLTLVIVAYSTLQQDTDSDPSIKHGTVKDLVFEYVEGHPLTTLVCSAVGAGLTFLVTILLVIGATKQKPCLLIPHIVMQICAVFALLIPSAIYAIHAGSTSARANTGESNSEFKSQLVFDIVALEAFLVSFALDLYFLYIVFRYFRILRRKNFQKAHVGRIESMARTEGPSGKDASQ